MKSNDEKHQKESCRKHAPVPHVLSRSHRRLPQEQRTAPFPDLSFRCSKMCLTPPISTQLTATDGIAFLLRQTLPP
jgi:hypothetical protein